MPKPRPIWLWEIDLGYKFTPLTENAVGSDPSDRIGKAGGITYSILKRTGRNGALFEQRSIPVDRSVTSYIAPEMHDDRQR